MIHLVTVVGSRLDLLPHMLVHYRDLGVGSLLVNIHIESYESDFYKEARSICDAHGASVVSTFAGAWFREVNPFLYRHSQRQFLDDWFILADVDEFQIYPRRLIDFFDEMDRCGYDYVQGCVLDRVARDGTFPPVLADTSLWEQYPLAGLVTPHILKAEFLKVVAAKGYVRLAPGQHYALTGMGCPMEREFIQVHHFKWSGDVFGRLRNRAEFYKLTNEPIWTESQRCVEHLAEHGGRLDIADPRLLLAESLKEYPHWEAVKQLIRRRLRDERRRNAI